jgi:predicted acylesterase/phospholipase RssA
MPPYDLLLSSGFLAFARHAGVLGAIEAAGVPIDAVVGTSSGSLVGALWCAGMKASEIQAEVAGRRPASLMGLSMTPWRGLFHLEPLMAWMRGRLPPNIEDLPRPFAVGVVTADKKARLLTSGPLPEAVAASCAMPHIFRPVEIGGEALADGGFADRLMVGPWRAWRGERPAIAHLIERSAGVNPTDDLSALTLIHTPRSGANFLSLGDVAAQAAEARLRAEAALVVAGLKQG